MKLICLNLLQFIEWDLEGCNFYRRIFALIVKMLFCLYDFFNENFVGNTSFVCSSHNLIKSKISTKKVVSKVAIISVISNVLSAFETKKKGSVQLKNKV